VVAPDFFVWVGQAGASGVTKFALPIVWSQLTILQVNKN